MLELGFLDVSFISYCRVRCAGFLLRMIYSHPLVRGHSPYVLLHSGGRGRRAAKAAGKSGPTADGGSSKAGKPTSAPSVAPRAGVDWTEVGSEPPIDGSRIMPGPMLGLGPR